MSNSEKAITPAETMQRLGQELRAHPSRTEGLNAVFAFDVSGIHGGKWWIEAKDGVGATYEGTHEGPDATIVLDGDVLVQMYNHDLAGATAFMEGLLSVEGDQSKAMFLAQIFGE